MARGRPCDACGAPRQSWQRLCGSCFRALPGDIRTGLTDAWKRKSKGAWRDFRRRARDFLAARPVRPAVAPETAYARTAAMLGEREP